MHFRSSGFGAAPRKCSGGGIVNRAYRELGSEDGVGG